MRGGAGCILYPECSLPPSSRHCPLRTGSSGLSIAVAWEYNKLRSMIRGSKGKIAELRRRSSRRIELLQVQVALNAVLARARHC